jgi:hypothetical protein
MYKMVSTDLILQKIFEMRGFKVILDADLAELYNVDTKRLNEQVKRNLARFPDDFMFRLTPVEWESMRSQIATASEESKNDVEIKPRAKMKRNLMATPYAFTEHGVAMLSSILRSERAIEMNIAIVRAFISLRQMVLEQKDLAGKLNQLKQELSLRLDDHDIQLSAIYEAIENLLDKKANEENWKDRERIGFK